MEFTFEKLEVKKHSTKFRFDDEEHPKMSFYVPTWVLEQLGNPDSLTVTVEAKVN